MRTIIKISLIIMLFGLTAAFNVGLVEIRVQEVDFLLGRIVTDQEMSNALGVVAKYELIKRRLEYGEEDMGSYEFEAKVQALTSGDQFTKKEKKQVLDVYLVPVRFAVSGIRYAMGKPMLTHKQEDKIFSVLEIGYFWERARKYPDAIKIYDQVLQKQNVEPDLRSAVLLHKAFCHSMISEYDKARALYENVINLFPGSEAGILAWKLLSFIESIDRERRKVSDENSNDFDAAKKYFMLMDYRNAIKYFARLISIRGNEPVEIETRFYKGRSHEELGETDEAIEEYRRVIRDDKSRRWSREASRRMLMLGEFYEQKKQMAEEAKRQLEEYKDQNFMKNVGRFSQMVSASSLRNELTKESGSNGEEVQVSTDARIMALLNSIGDLEGRREDGRRKILEETRKKWIREGMTGTEIKEIDRMVNLFQNPARKPAVLGESIRDNSSQLKYLYDKRLREGDKISGKMVVEIIIQSNGGVLSTRILQSNVGDSSFEAAILSQIATWKFAEVPDSLGNFTISYPFEFFREDG